MTSRSPDRYVQCALAGAPLPGLIVDVHMHLGEVLAFCVPHYGDLELFMHEMDRHGVDLCCPSGTPAVLGGALREGNDTVLDAIRRFPKRVFGWAAINPHYPDRMTEELQRCWDGGCRGVKIHNSIGLPYEHENYRGAYEFASERRMPVLAHTWGGELEKMEPFFRHYGTVRWSLAHAGAENREQYVRLARQYENVYLDTCYSRAPRGLIEYFVEQGVVEKLMFSSDCCFMGLSQQLGRVALARISEEDKALIFGGNARRFLGGVWPGEEGNP